MGLTKKFQEWKANRAEEKGYKKEVERERKLEFRRGYSEGSKSHAYEQGKAAAMGKPQSRGVVGTVSKVGAVTKGAGQGIQAFGDVFLGKGSGGYGGGGGLDFGFGGSPQKRQGPPVRTRTIMPSGKVIITEPVEQAKPKAETEQWDPWGSAPERKKGEKHPYDPF